MLLVRPRSVPVRVASPETAPLGLRRARSGLHEDPALFAGVRPFQPGDPRKRIHWRASARLGQPVSKRFEPATLRESVSCWTPRPPTGPFWLMAYEEEVLEGIVIAAASLCRAILGEGGACGLAVNALDRDHQPDRVRAHRPPATRSLARIDDTLARMSSYASAPFENLVATLPARVGPGTHDPRAVLA